MSGEISSQIKIDGLSCASCAMRAEKALSSLPGVRSASVNFATQTASLTLPQGYSAQSVSETLQTAGYSAVPRSLTFDIEGMTCATCVRRVEHALAADPGVLEARVNLASESAHVTYLDGLTDADTLRDHITTAGYTATPQSDAKTGQKPDPHETLRKQVILAALMAAPVFVVEMGGHLYPPFHHFIGQTIGHEASRLLQFLLTSLVLAGPGRVFFTKGFSTLWRRQPDMNALVALGAGAAYVFSVVATFAPHWLPENSANVYFEAAAVIVVLILFGRFLEARAKGQASAAIRKLLSLQARTAHVMRDGDWSDIPLEEVREGDRILTRPGETIAVDGEIVSGSAYIDESMISGEPVPVLREIGDRVIGGTLNGAAALEYRATHVGADTLLARIVRMVAEAQGAKLPIQQIIDRVTLWFVPAVMATALITFILWLILAPAPALGPALVAAVSVLIIACPCAMGLATPTSIMVGTGRAADLGVLFRRGDALQTLQDVDVIAVDKTGTLTEGRPDVVAVITPENDDEDHVLALAAAVERYSEHPIADAIFRHAESRDLPLPEVTDFTTVTGFGAMAQSGGTTIRVGSERLMRRDGLDPGPLVAKAAESAALGQTPLYVALDDRVAALIVVADQIKPSAQAFVDQIQTSGRSVAMLTGDSEITARAIGDTLGISRVHAGLLPQDKQKSIAEMQASGQKVAFVGDGINDAPALAAADVGIAVGTGTDIAIEAAEIVLMSGALDGVTTALDLSRRTMRNIRQNLFWAFGYNILLIPVAAGVLFPIFGLLLSPMLAAGAMALSSVFVVTNALRLRFVRPDTGERT